MEEKASTVNPCMWDSEGSHRKKTHLFSPLYTVSSQEILTLKAVKFYWIHATVFPLNHLLFHYLLVSLNLNPWRKSQWKDQSGFWSVMKEKRLLEDHWDIIVAIFFLFIFFFWGGEGGGYLRAYLCLLLSHPINAIFSLSGEKYF